MKFATQLFCFFVLLISFLFLPGCSCQKKTANQPSVMPIMAKPEKTEYESKEQAENSQNNESAEKESEQSEPQNSDSESAKNGNDETVFNKKSHESFVKQETQLKQAEQLFDNGKLEKAYVQAFQVWTECNQNKTPNETKQKIQQDAENLLKRISEKQAGGQIKFGDDSKTLVITVE
ncbi:MAG: hypothetical protein LBJ67_08110 [Planctomycetaceae bacterium]|jgi:hypothetical protein|nr:hypothetical protein [Planctomycetaceae bacterium]